MSNPTDVYSLFWWRHEIWNTAKTNIMAKHRFQDISNQKFLTLTFNLLRSSTVKSDCAESPWLLLQKSSLASNLVSVTIFKIFRIKRLWPWPVTSQGHPKWSPWVQHRNCSRSWRISRQNVTLIFDHSRSSKVKSDGANRESVGPAYKCSGASNLVSVAVHKAFRIKGCLHWPLTSQGHPKWNPWDPSVQPRDCCRSWHIRDISRQRIVTLTSEPQGHQRWNLMVLNVGQSSPKGELTC